MTGIGTLARRWAPWCCWLPVVFAAIFAVGLVHDLHNVLDNLYEDADAAAAPVLAQLALHAPAGSHITLGDHGYYEEFVTLLFTRGLPAHRALWTVGPALISLVGLAIIAWPVWRLFGAWAAAIVFAVLFCIGNLGLQSVLSWDDHGNDLFHAAVLVAALVLLLPRFERLSTRRLAVIAVALGLFSALPTSGDPLFIFWGVGPFLIAGMLAAYRLPHDAAIRLACWVGAVTLLTLIGAAAMAHIMSSAGIAASSAQSSLLVFATPAQLAKNIGSLLQGLTGLGAGDFFGKYAKNTAGAFDFATGALLLIAAATEVAVIRRRVIALAGPGGLRLARENASAIDAAALPGLQRSAYFAFWGSTLSLGVIAFMLGSPVPGEAAGRYLFGPYIAVVALLPLLLAYGRVARIAVAVGAGIFTLAANYHLHREPLPPAVGPDGTVAQQIGRFVGGYGARHGYSEYWDSMVLSWETHFHAQTFPVHGCPSQATDVLCTFTTVSIDSWYRRRPGQRSFLVVDPKWPDVSGPNPAFGAPIAQRTFGAIRVYVYPYDIASKLGTG